MTFGRGYEGGATRMGTKVILNVYDLSPANDALYSVGFGLHHSGVEISGREYTYAGGGGIFDHAPRDAPGARFRVAVDMGAFDGGPTEITRAISDLRDDFGPNGYNLLMRNCNHFANALCWSLLGKPIPAWVNRLADIGSCCSCLIPKQFLEDAPLTGGEERGGGEKNFIARGSRSRTMTSSFNGKGFVLGSSSSEASTGGIISGILGKVRKSPSRNSNRDDLTDRREKARKAALARMNRDGSGSSSANEDSSGNAENGSIREGRKYS